jgi:hypothetical protein
MLKIDDKYHNQHKQLLRSASKACKPCRLNGKQHQTSNQERAVNGGSQVDGEQQPPVRLISDPLRT